MKQTFRKLLIALLVFCTFVGVLPMIAAEDSTAQAAAATIYYDFRKANNGYPNAAADKRTAFEGLTYDEVASRNTTITSGPWAYHSYVYECTETTNYDVSVEAAYTYYHYDKTKGLIMMTPTRKNVMKSAVKFKGFNTGKYVPYINLNGAYLPGYSGVITANIRALNSDGTLGTTLVSKQIFLASCPDEDTYVPLTTTAISLTNTEYALEVIIDNERTIAIINGLELVAADSAIVSGLHPTNDLGVYEVKVGQTVNVPFTQVLSDGTTTTNKLSGWSYTTGNSYVTANVNSSSRYFTLTGVAETSSPQTIEFKVGNGKTKLNVIVRAADYTGPTGDIYYDFTKVLPGSVTVNHVHNMSRLITYGNTAVGGYGEVNKWTGTASATSVHSYPWKVASVADTVTFSPLFHDYGIQSKNYGVTDIKIQVPVAGVYMPQLDVYSGIGIQTPVTVSIINSSGTTVSTKTVPAGTTSKYNLATNALSLSAGEYTVRFNKTETGSSADAGANYYNGINLYKTNNTTVTLNPNGGTVGTKTSVTATYGSPMPGIDGEGYLPTRTGYRFGGFVANADGTGTQYYTMAGKSNHVWDQTSSTATIYATWNVNTFYVKYNANGGSGTMSNSTHTYNVAKNLTANTFTRTGYTFAGWATSASGEVKYANSESVKNLSATNQATVNLYAVWTPNTYSVKYNANGGSGTMSNSSHTYDTAKALTANAFSKTGYTFQGWDTSSAGTTVVHTDKKSVSNLTSTNGGTVNLYAVWKGNTYTVTFDFTNGSGGTASTTATYGSAMPEVTAPTKTGFTFAGYYDATSGGTKYYNADGTSARTWNKTEAATLYARWTRNTYAVTLDANGGTEGTTSVTASYNLAMPAIETLPTRTGYTFAGYYDATSGGTKYYNADGTSASTWNKTAAATLYARWTANTYTVTLNTGSSTSTVTATYGAAMPSITAPTKTGYTFGGYYTAENGGGTQYYTATGASARTWNKTEEITLYAKWTAKTSTVTLDAGGTVTATYGAAMPAITAPKAAGKVFGGYYDGENGAGTQYYTAAGASARTWNKTTATTLYAKWTAATVSLTNPGNKSVTAGNKLTFALSGSTNSGMGVTYSAENLPSGASFSGDTFTWTPTTSQIGSHSVTFKAVDGDVSASRTITITVKAPTSTVTLNTGSGTSTVTATYGSEMPAITVPTKTGYIFSGYYTEENGSGTQYYKADGSSAKNWDKTGNVTLYANWIQGEVTITQIGDKTIAVEETLAFNVEASSTASDDITYTAENLPEGASFNETTGAFSWTPSKDQVGEYTIIFKGSDGLNYAEVTIKVTVDEIISTVNFDEGQEEDIIATYGETLPTITPPEKEGYIFDGYFDGEGGTGTKYYNYDGTPAKTWDKKDANVTLYAKWTQGDTRLGTRVAVLRDITYKDEDGNTKFGLYLLAGIDSLAYKEVGFEVTIDGATISKSTQIVYQQIKDNKNTYLPSAFGKLCQYGFVLGFEFGKEFKDKTVTFRAYAVDHDESTIYGKQTTFEGVYTDLIEDDENGGDLIIDGEIEYA